MTNLLTLIDDYSTDAKCRELLEDLRWPDGVACLRCGSKNVSELQARPVYDCNDCRHQFSVTAGTIMHDSHLPLRKWFLAIYLMCESKKGISANQIKRTIGVAYKTAWYLSHRHPRSYGKRSIPRPDVARNRRSRRNAGRRQAARQGPGIPQKQDLGSWRSATKRRYPPATDSERQAVHASRLHQPHDQDEAEAIYTDELASYLGIEDHNTRHEPSTIPRNSG